MATIQDLRYGTSAVGSVIFKSVITAQPAGRFIGSITGDQTAYNVSNGSCVAVTSVNPARYIYGLSGGIENQDVSFAKTGTLYTVVFMHNHAAGNQKFQMIGGVDKTIGAGFGGIRFRYMDGYWWEIAI